MNMTEIYDALNRLGITANYTGFFHTSYAIYLAVQQPERLVLVTKWLYPDVARRYETSWCAVERNIRSMAGMAWAKNAALLEEMARCPLTRRPTASRFVAIVAAYLSREEVA